MSDTDKTGPIEVIEGDAPYRTKGFRPSKQVRQVGARKDRHSVRQVLHRACSILNPRDVDIVTHSIQGHFSTNRHTVPVEA